MVAGKEPQGAAQNKVKEQHETQNYKCCSSFGGALPGIQAQKEVEPNFLQQTPAWLWRGRKNKNVPDTHTL